MIVYAISKTINSPKLSNTHNAAPNKTGLFIKIFSAHYFIATIK